MTELKLPSLGEGVEKGIVVAIMVKVGDVVSIEQPLIEVETDKVTAEVPSENAGTIKSILVNIGDEIPTGHPFIKMVTSEPSDTNEEKTTSAPEEIKQPAEVVESTKETVTPRAPISIEPSHESQKVESLSGFRASPLARKIAREIGIEITSVKSNQPSGRISVQDVKDHAKMLHQGKDQYKHLEQKVDLPDFNRWGSTRHEALTGIAQATSKNMSLSWSQIPHAWLQEKADITLLEKMRQQNKASIKDQGGSLTITCILVKALANALNKNSIFNTTIDVNSKTLIFKDYINIGVAVDTERGLVVPVIKNADQKSMTDIAIELTTLSSKARNKKLISEDLAGATFTISNLGGIGTTGIFPIVNFPQVAILGVAGSKIESVWVEDAFYPRLMMPMTIGFDHRVINGADAARFLNYVKELMENWMTWVL